MNCRLSSRLQRVSVDRAKLDSKLFYIVRNCFFSDCRQFLGLGTAELRYICRSIFVTSLDMAMEQVGSWLGNFKNGYQMECIHRALNFRRIEG